MAYSPKNPVKWKLKDVDTISKIIEQIKDIESRLTDLEDRITKGGHG